MGPAWLGYNVALRTDEGVANKRSQKAYWMPGETRRHMRDVGGIIFIG